MMTKILVILSLQLVFLSCSFNEDKKMKLPIKKIERKDKTESEKKKKKKYKKKEKITVVTSGEPEFTPLPLKLDFERSEYFYIHNSDVKQYKLPAIKKINYVFVSGEYETKKISYNNFKDKKLVDTLITNETYSCKLPNISIYNAFLWTNWMSPRHIFRPFLESDFFKKSDLFQNILTEFKNPSIYLILYEPKTKFAHVINISFYHPHGDFPYWRESNITNNFEVILQDYVKDCFFDDEDDNTCTDNLYFNYSIIIHEDGIIEVRLPQRMIETGKNRFVTKEYNGENKVITLPAESVFIDLEGNERRTKQNQ